MIDTLLNSEAFWGLTGVLLGFILGEVSALARNAIRLRRLKKALKEELKAIDSQLDQKIDIVEKAIAALNRNSILPTKAVRVVTTGYRAYLPDLYPKLSVVERNCLHVAYERLRVAEEELEGFEDDIQRKISEDTRKGAHRRAFRYWLHRMTELLESYHVVRRLVRSYLNDEPIDVFYVDGKEASRRA